MVKLCEGPGQSTDPLLNEGVTVIVADIGEVPVFVAVNAKVPVPSAPKPMAVLLFVHEYVVNPPVFTVVNETVFEEPLHITMLAGILTCPSGFTVMLNDLEGPGQLVPPLVKTGVTVIVPVIG